MLVVHHDAELGHAGVHERDVRQADHLLHAGERTHNLDELTRKYLKHENISISQLIGKGKKQLTMDQVPTGQVKDYAAEDADTAFRLAELLEPELEPLGLRKLYDDLEIPLIAVLAAMGVAYWAKLDGRRAGVWFIASIVLTPLGSSVAVWEPRAVLMFPAELQELLVGSYSSALAR